MQKGYSIGYYDRRGNIQLYQGYWFTRSSAIAQHCLDKGKTWKDCKKAGDLVFKVEVTAHDSRKV